ncbi:MAG: hypothetical protein JWO05_2381 [Gemmatimonadetes bacterium]|nr:hypothetical protein [Gemmatimonadota bacterium]
MKKLQGHAMQLLPAMAMIVGSSTLFAQGVVTATISQPPATAAAGASMNITETVWNSGTGTGGGGTQTLYLVPTGGTSGAAIAVGSRSIPSLSGGGLSTATTAVTIPASVSAGTYVIGAGGNSCGMGCLKSTGAISVSAATVSSFPLSLQLNMQYGTQGTISVDNPSTGAHIASCTSSCTSNIPAGNSVRVAIAYASLSTVFQGWSAGSNTGCAAGTAPCVFTMNSAKQVAANFTAASNGAPVTVTVYVMGPGTVSGGWETGALQHQNFNNCNATSAPGCVTSGPAGTAFAISATPGTVPASGPFGQSHAATFTGFTGCSGMPQGTTSLRLVPTSNVTCVAHFQ